MSISKKTLALAELIRPKVSKPEIVGKEAILNTEGAYAASLEDAGFDIEMVQKVLQHDKRFITALTHITGEVAEEQFKDNEEVEAVIMSASIDDLHSHTVRVQKIHEPTEGKPQYGLVQVHSAFGMDGDTSEEFKKVSRAISKNIRAIAG